MVKKTLYDKNEQIAVSMLSAIRGIGTKETLNLIEGLAFDASAPIVVRR